MATTKGKKKSTGKSTSSKNTRNTRNSKNTKNARNTSRNKKTRSNSKSKSGSKKVDDNKKRLYDEVAAILLLAFGVFFAVAMHTHLAGAVGEIVSSTIKGLFGIGGYILPYLVILYSLMIFAKMNRPFKSHKLVYVLLIYIMIIVMNGERYLDRFVYGKNVSFIYEQGVNLNNGGVVGMYLSYFIDKAIGGTGLYIMAISIIVICLLLIVETPFSKAYDKANEKKKALKEKKAKIAKDKAEKKNELEYNQGQQLEIATDYNQNFLASSAVEETRYIPDVLKARKNKKSIINLLKNDANYGINKKGNDEEKIENITEEKQVHKKPEIFSLDIDNEETPAMSEIGITEEGFVSKDKKVIEKNKEEKLEEEMFFRKDVVGSKSNYKLPPVNLLNKPVRKKTTKNENQELMDSAMVLEKTLKSFNVEAKVVNVTRGSSVTRYEIQPAIGVKVASIVRLSDDIALNLRARSIRIEAPIPGKAAVGIEVENEHREMVTIGEIIGSREFNQNPSKLAFAVGRDIGGKPVIADLAKMPHMLIAGATGSGKSVCINTIIASILYRAKPDEVKLLLIDPKMVELGNYNGIPHLLIPVVTDSAKAAAALNWAVAEMTERYKKFASTGVRDIKSYNALMRNEEHDDEVLPQIVIIIDELADLMMVASSQVEDAICRLAQLARAAGMHLIVATQRPSVDVVTGLIKANIPSRIAFMVSSQVDSRTIIDMTGAEKLVGNGDMLYKPQDLDKPLRVQGPFISDDEVHKIITYVKSQVEEADYNEEVISQVEKGNVNSSSNNETEDDLMQDAIELIVKAGQASISMLQRRFRIGYNRAARMIEDMEQRGIVGPPDGPRGRTVLMSEEELLLSKEKMEE